ncbi:MAG: response regulator [Pseudomonadota bacterium]
MSVPSIRVIVVDDEDTILLNLVAFLEYANFDVLSASSGEQAMQILSDEDVDVGIIDMRLPGMDGNTVILKGHHLKPKMKFLILTGSTNYLIPEVLKQINVKDEHLFRKPLPDMNVLIRAIHKLVPTKEINADE